MTKSNRGLAVVIMAVILFATIFAIPVPNAAAASRAADRKPGRYGRYVIPATVTRNDVISGLNLNDNEVTYMFSTFEDIDGEEWVYAYELTDEFPPVNQTVILVMDANGTPNDITDDIIEDVLWASCNEID